MRPACHAHGLFAAFRRQGALAGLIAFVLAFAATTRAYAVGVSALDEPMCRVVVAGVQQGPASGSDAIDHSCCDLCICAFAATSVPPPMAVTLAARLPRTLRRDRPSGERRPSTRRPLRLRLRDPPVHS